MSQLDDDVTVVITNKPDSELYAVFEESNFDVNVGESAKIDVKQAINYIKSGQAEIAETVGDITGEFNDNAVEKTNAFNQNAEDKISAFDLNATNKINDFNINAVNKTTNFNDNATSKTGAFDSNAVDKTNDFNLNASNKTTDFNNNYLEKKALIDAEVQTAEAYSDEAKQWAIGEPTEPTGYSAKYWAEASASAAATVGNGTITLTQGGVTKGTFTTNQSGNTTINLDAGGSGGGAVDSVNGQTGTVVLTASDVGALPDTTVIPTATSDLTNDSGFITGISSSDVTTALGYTPANDSNVVKTTGNQTIAGDKTFTNDITILSPTLRSYISKSSTLDLTNSSRASELGANFRALDKNGNIGGDIRLAFTTNGSSVAILQARNRATGGLLYCGVYAELDNSGNRVVRPRENNNHSLGSASYLWKEIFASNGSINTSDERLKQQISDIPECVLNAWGNVDFCQYKFNDAVSEKGEKARFHTGIIAQNIERIFKEHGLNAFDYGLICYDEWAAEKEEYEENGELIHEARDAGNRYALRYEECLCMEAAYQRRRADRIEQRLEALEKNSIGEKLTS